MSRLRFTIASAAVAVLALPALALAQKAAPPAQGPAPTLSETSTSGFPDKAYLVTLPSTQPLTEKNVGVTENGEPVLSLGVAPPGGSKSEPCTVRPSPAKLTSSSR